ncbi:MAG TPA: histidine phosphatase family protein [Roseiarcus sp.]|nr:histidine phosphatase family protein [Roseiarcus sp.]
MLRLLLLRHAKAVPHDPARDHGRALAERGRADAKRLGKLLAGESRAIEAAVHSGARRAEETALIALGELPKGVPVSAEPRLYEATPAGVIAALRDLPDAATTILVVGHNPSLAEAALRLAGSGDQAALARMAAKYPTCGLATIDFDVADWKEISAGGGRLVAFLAPAGLGGSD